MLLDVRFITAVVLIPLVFAVGAVCFVNDHAYQIEAYSEAMNRTWSEFEKAKSSLYKTALHKQLFCRRPRALSFVVAGTDKAFPNTFQLNAYRREYPELRTARNPLLSSFSELDWMYIVSCLLSFAAVVFTYDSICSEKRGGTLRLVLVAPTLRSVVILGKFLGVFITLGIPMILGMLTSLVIVSLSPGILLTGGDWCKIPVIVALCFVFLSLFILLGLWVSSRASSSASSIISLLFLWVGINVLVPCLAYSGSKYFKPVSTQAELLEHIKQENERLLHEALSGKYGRNACSYNPDVNSVGNNPSAVVRFQRARTESWNKTIDDHFTRMVQQMRTALFISRVSPLGLFRCAADVIAGTGVNRLQEVQSHLVGYQDRLRTYVHEEDAKDLKSLHLCCDNENIARWWRTISHQPVTLFNVPTYQEPGLSIRRALKTAVWDMAILVMLSVISFGMTFLSFARCDVR